MYGLITWSFCQVLLELGARVATADSAGENALFAALTARQWTVAAALLEAGGTELLAVQNADGRTCVSYALEDGNETEVRALVGVCGADADALLAGAAAEVAAERTAQRTGPVFVRFSGTAGEAYVGARGRTVGFRGFCSVRAGAVCRAGRAAYMEVTVEVLCDAPQFGFCGPEWRRITGRAAAGVGDDAASWGVDGARACAWHAQQPRDFGGLWRAGDVIGLACDLRESDSVGGRVWVSFNGSFAAPYGAAFDLPIGLSALYPALSARASRVCYNFGPTFVHAPPAAGYGPFEVVDEADGT